MKPGRTSEFVTSVGTKPVAETGEPPLELSGESGRGLRRTRTPPHGGTTERLAGIRATVARTSPSARRVLSLARRVWRSIVVLPYI